MTNNPQPVPTRTPEVLTAEQVRDIRPKHRSQRTDWKDVDNLCDTVETLRTALAQRTEERDHWQREADNWKQSRMMIAEHWESIAAELPTTDGIDQTVTDKARVWVRRAKAAEAALAQAREQRDAVLRDVANIDPLRSDRDEMGEGCIFCGAWGMHGEQVFKHESNCTWTHAVAASGRGSAPQ